MRSIRQNDDDSWSIMDKREGEVARFRIGDRVRIRGIDDYLYESTIAGLKIDKNGAVVFGYWDDEIEPFPHYLENIEYIKAMTVLDAQ